MKEVVMLAIAVAVAVAGGVVEVDIMVDQYRIWL